MPAGIGESEVRKMYEEMKELRRIYKTLNADGRKALLNVGKGLLCNRRYRKAEQHMTPEQFDLCVDKVIEMCK